LALKESLRTRTRINITAENLGKSFKSMRLELSPISIIWSYCQTAVMVAGWERNCIGLASRGHACLFPLDSGQIVEERGERRSLPFLAGERRSPSLHDRCGWTRKTAFNRSMTVTYNTSNRKKCALNA